MDFSFISSIWFHCNLDLDFRSSSTKISGNATLLIHFVLEVRYSIWIPISAFLMHHAPIFVGCSIFLLCSIVWCYADAGSACSKTSPLVDFQSGFQMVQHQLRGSFRIIDDCSFKVSNFDMLSGTDVHWWGAIVPDLTNFTVGFVVSDQKLNDTYRNASFIVHLKKNVKWDQIQVIAAWDLPTASDFGHVILRRPNNEPAASPNLAPSPSEGGNSEEENGSISIEPTTFENCKVLADNYRVRWTLNTKDKLIEVGLEAAIPTTNYMAFGWANPKESSNLMIGADVAVMGFNEDGVPVVDDFYITKPSECMISKDGTMHGVCPDTIFEGSDPVGLVNNTKLIYGHRRDGVSFVRYQRPLVTIDKKYDIPINHTEYMTVIWAMGLMKPPDAIRPFYLPQNHGETYGHLVLNVSEHVNDCLGPLDAEDKDDQDVVIADANAPLVVTSGSALHYPNPPNPAKVLYINKKEAPLLRVERGVPVKFSIQAGHDIALYITSDMLGGNATMRNMSETIYAGGPEAEGVEAYPMELIWEPDRNTPDQVFYQSIYQPKMGWRVQVVDGGLSDMYNNSVLLDDQQVTFFWTLSEDSITIAARGEKKSGYLAVGFGSGMINSYSYVGWMDETGEGRVSTYWIDGKEALNVHPTKENLTFVRCKSENGIITFEFTRPLKPSCTQGIGPECKNVIDPTTPLKVVWAMGAKWVDEHLSDRNMHSSRSSRPMRVLLMRGSAEVEEDLQPVLAVHGFMMFLAWGILLPGGILAARYLKHVKGDGWYRIHVYLQYSGLSIVLLGLLFAIAELRGFYVSSTHVKFGITAILLACMQPVNAYFRPKRPGNGEVVSSQRILWEYSHAILGRCAIGISIVAQFIGMKNLGDRYGHENVHGLIWALIIWFMIIALMSIYLEYQEKQRRRDKINGRSNWVLGNNDDSLDLLGPTISIEGKESHLSGTSMEVQLQPLRT